MPIRPATAQDLPVIEALAQRIWPEAYGSILQPAQIAYMLERMYAQPALKEAMVEGQQFLLAEMDAAAVGFASWGLERVGVAKLHKLYVLAELRKTGLGGALLGRVSANARAAGAVRLILNVNRHNAAQKFYEGLGFGVQSEVDIDIGAGYWMNDYVMEKPLT